MAAAGRVDEDSRIDFIRVASGAATPTTIRFTEVEDMLLGQLPGRDLIAAAKRQVAATMIGVTGRRWSTEFTEPVIEVMAARAMERVFGSDSGE